MPLKIGAAWFYIGLIICLVALSIYDMATFNIGKTQIVDEPVTKGVYRFSSHPIYLGGFVLFLGIGIVCASWLFVLFALAWIILWLIAVPSQESDVSEKHGDAYRECMKRTPRRIGIPKSGRQYRIYPHR